MELNYAKVYNFEGAFRGMRAPMSSWKKSDSIFTNDKTIIGDNDLRLAQQLIRAGNEHAKFMRQIFVSVDITAPIYWWKEMDTYKVSTVSNSTSTMHKLTSKPITIDDFSFDNLEIIVEDDSYTIETSEGELLVDGLVSWKFKDYIESVIEMCEILRQKFIDTNDKRYWRALIQLLPESYNQTRTWTANYAILRNIYFQRKNHKLVEWHQFCDWIKFLPCGEDLIILGDTNEN
jgi:hypothetical protein